MPIEDDDLRPAGIRIVNDEGLPNVEVSRAVVARGYQSFDVKTDRETFNFYVTPKGYMRVSKPQRRKHG